MNDSRKVEVFLEPARTCRRRWNSYCLAAEGETELLLPVSLTELRTEATPDGEVVVSVVIPEFIAVDRGLVESDNDDDDGRKMTRDDWFLLGTAVALLIRGETLDEALWQAGKVAEKLKRV